MTSPQNPVSPYATPQPNFPPNSAPWPQNMVPMAQPRSQSMQYIQSGQAVAPQRPLAPSMTNPQPGGVPYAYGQLPSALNPSDPKSQHPIPGSFNRHAFNPQTQSFVPGSSGVQLAQQSPDLHGPSQQASPHLPYTMFPTVQQQYGSNGTGYDMIRQGSNGSLPSYHASPHLPSRQVLPGMAPGMPQPLHSMQMSPGVGPIGAQSSHAPHGLITAQQPGSHLPHFGNPASLPPKPPVAPTGL